MQSAASDGSRFCLDPWLAFTKFQIHVIDPAAFYDVKVDFEPGWVVCAETLNAQSTCEACGWCKPWRRSPYIEAQDSKVSE